MTHADHKEQETDTEHELRSLRLDRLVFPFCTVSEEIVSEQEKRDEPGEDDRGDPEGWNGKKRLSYGPCREGIQTSYSRRPKGFRVGDWCRASSSKSVLKSVSPCSFATHRYHHSVWPHRKEYIDQGDQRLAHPTDSASRRCRSPESPRSLRESSEQEPVGDNVEGEADSGEGEVGLGIPNFDSVACVPPLLQWG